MKKTMLLLLLLCVFYILAGCDTFTNKRVFTVLKASPFSSADEGADPVILGSFTDDEYNYYLIDVGYISNAYISTMALAHYNGSTPITLTASSVTEYSLTRASTKTVSDSVTITTGASVKVGLESSVSGKIPGIADFSVKMSTEWTGSLSKALSSSRSIETSVSDTQKTAESVSTSFTIGEHGEKAGYYRYALYAICDVYFIMTTSLDNEKLHSWDTSTCVRQDTVIPHLDYSENGVFDNSPQDGASINFKEDFHKNFPLPEKNSNNNLNTYTLPFVSVREEERIISYDSKFSNPHEAFNFSLFDVNLKQMKDEGYKTVSIRIKMDVREINNGYQHIFLFKGAENKNKSLMLAEIRFEHTPGKYDGEYWQHNEYGPLNNVPLVFENINIEEFTDSFFFRYGASGADGNKWANKNLMIQLVFEKPVNNS